MMLTRLRMAKALPAWWKALSAGPSHTWLWRSFWRALISAGWRARCCFRCLPIPKPAIQDEFSYLLASDTFASGRLTNPTPPLAEHFETLQEIVQPTYASKYPPLLGPGDGAWPKALGRAVDRRVAELGVLCATLCWALQGWLPPVWALAGSLIALLRIGIVSYWTESYWGGSCAAIGGALVIGAVPRLIRRPRAGCGDGIRGGSRDSGQHASL